LIDDVPDGPGTGRVHRSRAVAAAVAAVAAALVAAAVAGCGGGGSEGSGSSSSASVSTTQTTSSQTATRTTSTTSTGGGPGTGQVGQFLSIPQVVKTVLTSSDPAKTCGTQYVTQHYLSAAYGGRQGCVQAQNPKNSADALRVGPVTQASNEPRMASVKASPRGGLYDGEKLTVSVVKEQDTWKVDGLKSNAPVGP
jgi:hypothetical protein